MITPSFSLTATERILPSVEFNFLTTALDPRITFTRANNTATYTNSSGVITAINANLPRFDYNPTTLVCRGLLIEEARTNLLLNSLIDGTSLSTQSVTVAATAYTLSFYGTGSINLSGTTTATVAGTGAYPARTTYTFTPTAGSLTLTVTGTVQYAQLEAGAFATSFIPTAGTSVTRSADVATVTGTNLTSWYNQTEGSFEVTGSSFNGAVTKSLLSVDDGTTQNRMTIRRTSANAMGSLGVVSNVTQWNDGTAANTWVNNTTGSVCLGYKLNNIGFALNGATTITDTSATVPTISIMRIGEEATGAATTMCGYIQKIMYWPFKITNNEIRAFSK